MLAAVIAARTAEQAVKGIKNAKGADLIELRLDCINGLSSAKLKELIKSCTKPVIITNRKRDEGGFFNGSEEERVQVLVKAIEFGADFVDIEYSSDKNLIKNLIKRRNKTKIIVSYHNFKETPDNIRGVYSKIKKLNCGTIKIVTQANSVVDNFRIFELIEAANKENQKIIAFCMGSYGKFGRILSLALGSQVTYASVENGKESASGQPKIHELVSHYRIKKLNKNTKIAGLIGNPVEHSWSDIMHNAGFGKLGINAVYLKFRVDRLREFFGYFRQANALGFSVTIPHKIDVIKYLDEIDEKAKEIGAVNTIAIRNKKLIGCNTDCGGAMLALKEKTSLKSKNAVILGAGGSARAIAYGLREENAGSITLLNRTVEKAKVAARDFGCGYGPLCDLKNMNYDILINTTSVGMHPDADASIIPSRLIKKGSVVFDIVFNPFKTKLLKDAEKKGCKIVPGFEMLVNGAMLQFKLWTNKDAPEKLMREKVMEHLKNACN